MFAASVEDDGVRMTRISSNGTAHARGTTFQVSPTLAGAIVYRAEDDEGC